ncbi:hypothetical protein CS063_08820 [Sporanaerobium hydrogeniformans]|uniref:Uncharacterized protein n=1 Tax=Sporanaerobium hydrogeniformans TaxID=3072179 RepID=A0AC61DDS8_9FIRM|nr:hypothetical protein [Sporanaerobium hydrogeniformans]PHV70856.1 hypothetical protein CS063_08820 [Sporanaerobium hydrogeniformans]
MNENKPVLLIDQDDVLAEYIKGVTAAFNRKYNTCFKATECDNWNLHILFGEDIETVMHEPELFRHLEPAPHAREVFERLYFSNLFEMYIVTAANPRAVEAKHEWIKEHLPFFPLNRVIVCSCKYMIKGDYLLDDGMHNIEEFNKTGGMPIVFERPHNLKTDHGFKKVSDWLAFERFIMEQCYPDKIGMYLGSSEEQVI